MWSGVCLLCATLVSSALPGQCFHQRVFIVFVAVAGVAWSDNYNNVKCRTTRPTGKGGKSIVLKRRERNVVCTIHMLYMYIRSTDMRVACIY